jgi:hypothetical protein
VLVNCILLTYNLDMEEEDIPIVAPVSRVFESSEGSTASTSANNSSQSANTSPQTANALGLDLGSIMDVITRMTPDKAKDYIDMIPEGVIPTSIRTAIVEVLQEAAGAASGNKVKREKVLAAIQGAVSSAGFDLTAIAKKFIAEKNQLTGSIPVTKGAVHVIWIKESRSASVRQVPGKNLEKSASLLLKGKPETSLMSRLSIGPWKGKDDRVWLHQGSSGKKNRRASHILGYTSSSELLIYVEGHPATVQELENVEEMLRASMNDFLK